MRWRSQQKRLRLFTCTESPFAFRFNFNWVIEFFSFLAARLHFGFLNGRNVSIFSFRIQRKQNREGTKTLGTEERGKGCCGKINRLSDRDRQRHLTRYIYKSKFLLFSIFCFHNSMTISTDKKLYDIKQFKLDHEKCVDILLGSFKGSSLRQVPTHGPRHSVPMLIVKCDTFRLSRRPN